MCATYNLCVTKPVIMKKIYFELLIPSYLHKYKREDFVIMVRASKIDATTALGNPVISIEYLGIQSSYEFKVILNWEAVEELAIEKAISLFTEKSLIESGALSA